VGLRRLSEWDADPIKIAGRFVAWIARFCNSSHADSGEPNVPREPEAEAKLTRLDAETAYRYSMASAVYRLGVMNRSGSNKMVGSHA
jgi:hypothetical protein